ncbi:acyltransferase family protein [Wenxinia marina]|uniref:Acyltransferase 3 domain-containing protein n=1 Tax=Wenxinia marina DSM 24838 TaxID=1123501 RepID=A0A0D0Q7M2_9RHOB|nr:acyltransferase family protein [Wenxinia marina]KIQ70459.1 hypothetical protein Wenmar_00835 [Wenxinia marina DSM 24838]GGL52975.1 serine racemase [Wenxinia marina]
MDTDGRTGDGSRLAALDLARLVFAVVVVLAHGRLFEDVSTPLFAAFVNGPSRVVVPFFLIVSGYFFESGTRRGLRPWIGGIVRLYLVWSAIYLPLAVLIEPMPPDKTLFYLVTGYAHLWFLPALAGGGAVLWLVRGWRTWRLFVLALAAVLTGATVQYLLNYVVGTADLPHRNAWIALSRNFLFLGFPYLAFGYLLRRRPVASGPWLWPALAAACLVIAAETWVNYRALGLGGFFDITLGAIVTTPLLLIALLRWRGAPGAAWMAPLSAALYLVHPLVLYPLFEFAHLPPRIVAPLTLALSLPLACGLVWAGRSLRIRRYARRTT